MLTVVDNSRAKKTGDSLQGACLDSCLVEKLCCPACKGDLKDENGSAFVCTGCGRTHPIVDGIPDLVYYPEEEPGQSSFNNLQARYERDLEDYEALHDYEDRVVKVYGDKTELIATCWARVFQGPILDYGCGTGQLSRVLKRYHSPVYAFDISRASICRNVQDNNVVAVAANAFHLPFRDCCFETVCCNGVLHHIIDLGSAVKEMARVANRSIAISEPCTTSYHRTPWSALRDPRELARALLRATLLRALALYQGLTLRRKSLISAGGKGSASKYERPLDPQEVIELLEQAGFRVTLLRFWTNLSWKGRSRLKKVLTGMLVSSEVGSHFEIRAERFDKPRAVPYP